MSKYTTNEKLSIQGAEGDGKSKVVAQSSSASDKVKSRLDQLDDLEGGGLQEALDLSQQEYINRIEELNAVCVESSSSGVVMPCSVPRCLPADALRWLQLLATRVDLPPAAYAFGTRRN